MEEFQTTWQKQVTCIVGHVLDKFCESIYKNIHTYVCNNNRCLLHWTLSIDYPQILQQSYKVDILHR